MHPMSQSTIDPRDARIERLEQVVTELQTKLEKAERTFTRLQTENTSLKTQLEKLKRQHAKSIPAPFSKGMHKTNPQPSGRKKGVGNFRYRTPPAPSEINRFVRVENPLLTCPDCAGMLIDAGTSKAWITDIPEIIKPVVTEYEIKLKRCSCCSRIVRGVHEDLGHDQLGVSAHRLGTRVKALSNWLHHDKNVSLRALPEILKATFGIHTTQSALTKDALKHGRTDFLGLYEKLRNNIKTAIVTHTDDTGWRIHGDSAFMMAFKTASEVVFQIRDSHTNVEVREVIGDDYQGTLVTDRFSSYDHASLTGVKQQKCVGHIQRNLTEALETRVGRAREFPLRLRSVFKGAVRLHTRFKRGELSFGDLKSKGRRFQRELTKLLEERVLSKANTSLRVGLAKHHARGNLRIMRLNG
jgi:transposase